MKNVTLIQEFEASAQEVWQLLARFDVVVPLEPWVEQIEMLSAEHRGPGAVRRCRLADGQAIVERVTQWHNASGYTVNVEASPWPIRSAQRSIQVTAIGIKSSLIILEFNYTPRWGVLGKLLDRLATRQRLRHVLLQYVEGLKRALDVDPPTEIGHDDHSRHLPATPLSLVG